MRDGGPVMWMSCDVWTRMLWMWPKDLIMLRLDDATVLMFPTVNRAGQIL